MSKIETIAQFMINYIKKEKIVYRDDMVNIIIQQFGDEYAAYTSYGNLTLNENIFKTFRKLAKNINWDRQELLWEWI